MHARAVAAQFARTRVCRLTSCATFAVVFQVGEISLNQVIEAKLCLNICDIQKRRVSFITGVERFSSDGARAGKFFIVKLTTLQAKS